MTGTGAVATAINGNKWRHRMKTSALGDSGADASSDSAFADTSLSLVAAASSDSASERVEVEQAHSLKEAFRPGRGLFRWFGLGKSGPRHWFLGRMPTYAMYDSSDYSYANSVGDLTFSASETMYSNAYLSIPIHHPYRVGI